MTADEQALIQHRQRRVFSVLRPTLISPDFQSVSDRHTNRTQGRSPLESLPRDRKDFASG